MDRHYPTRIVLFLLAFLQHTAAVGGNPTDFTVASATTTNVFKLSEAKGKFVALHFLLKTECPFCLRYTQEYRAKSASDPRVVHIFLKPDSLPEIQAWSTKLGTNLAPMSIYHDANAELAKDFSIPDGYKFHGQLVHFPALVLLDGQGHEVYRYVGKNNSDRLPYPKFLKKVEELTQPSPH